MVGALPASAASSYFVRNCETISISLSGYPTTGNTFTYSIDNAAPETIEFGSTLSYRVAFDDLGGSDKPHSWRISVDAPGTKSDRLWTGSSKGCR